MRMKNQQFKMCNNSIKALFYSMLMFSSVFAAGAYKSPPQADEKQMTKMARLGEDTRLFCPINGNPVPIISWTKGKEQINTYAWDRFKPSKKSLRIKSVTKEDTGTYVCKGTNGFGSEEIKIDLIVIDPSDFPYLKDGELPDVAPPVLTPITRTRPDVIVRKTGENLRLPCEAMGRPEPDVHWERLGGGRSMMMGVGGGGSRASLVIDNLKESDSGVFACVASNMVGRTSRNFTLKVEDGSGNPSLPGGPKNTTVKLGQRGKLECHIMSRAGVPEVKWLKKVEDEEDGGRFSGGSSGDVFDVGSDEKFRMVRSVEEATSVSAGRYVDVLVFDETDAADAGLYYCFVTNKVGYKYKSAYLNVIQNADSYVTIGSSSSPGRAKLVVVIAAIVVAAIVVTFFLVYCFCKNKGANLNNSNASSSTKRPPTSTSMADDVQENLMPQQQQQQQQIQQQQQQPIIKPHPHHYHYQQQQYQASMNNNRNAAYPSEPPQQPPPAPPPSVYNDNNSWQVFSANSIINEGNGFYSDAGNQYETPHVVTRPGGSGDSSGGGSLSNGRYPNSLYGGGGYPAAGYVYGGGGGGGYYQD